MNLNTPLKEVGKTYKMFSSRLERLGITTVEDLLFHIPFRYENYSIISKIAQVQPGETLTVQGKVLEIKNDYTRKRFRLQRATIYDDTGSMECIWFNQPYIIKIIHKDDYISIAGKAEKGGSKLSVKVNSYEVLSDGNAQTTHTGRLVPVYPETRGLSSKWIRNRVKELLLSLDKELSEFLPEKVLRKYNLMDISVALTQAHFPKTSELAINAKKRLSFDELFITQLLGQYKKEEWKKEKVTNFFKIAPFREQIKQFWTNLPFELTNAQKKAVKEIFQDLASNHPMNRLLEGDVGSGKTVVATIAMYIAYLNNFQSVLMAPTEILAQQHFQTVSKLLEPLGVKTGLVTGNKKLSTINSQFSILVGTHALLSESVNFDKLGLVVIDEQQRFGVQQRSLLRKKGINPHVLIMTATPIPRTIALTLFGDLDLSYLDEMPIGRIKVKTWLVPPNKRGAAYEWIKKMLKEKDVNGHTNQAFVICPFIEQSETMSSVKSAVKEYEYLKKDVFLDFNIKLLHGRMKTKEKDEILQQLHDRKLDILVATPVVEVGIDIPNATIIVIEASERFGLSQLHQLRGRVGRRNRESFCLLFTTSKSYKTKTRLTFLETTHQGAKLAELDLKLRGPGDVYGTLQHGNSELKIASYSDFELIEQAKSEVDDIFPRLNEFPKLVEKIKSYKSENVSPD